MRPPPGKEWDDVAGAFAVAHGYTYDRRDGRCRRRREWIMTDAIVAIAYICGWERASLALRIVGPVSPMIDLPRTARLPWPEA